MVRRDDSPERQSLRLLFSRLAVELLSKDVALMRQVYLGSHEQRWLASKPLLIVVKIKAGVFVGPRAKVHLLAKAANLFLRRLRLRLKFGAAQ